MFYLIPSNRQEHLITMLQALIEQQKHQPGHHPFTPTMVVVESQGMKHYVSLALAKSTGIAINLEFPLLSRAIYELGRLILGKDAIPVESAYKREILVWRILALFETQAFQNSASFGDVASYWQSASDQQLAKYHLAKQLADVLEQYVQFRPAWIENWSQGCVHQDIVHPLQEWQRTIWQLLVAEDAQHPVALINQAMQHVAQPKHPLPKQIYIFAVNALSPKQIEFFECIAQYIDVYFFHINPCMEFWGDLRSDKEEASKAIKSSIEKLQNEASPNPLLANLGQQGRTLFNQLHNAAVQDITESQLFSSALFAQNQEQKDSPHWTMLQHVQHSMLTLKTPSSPVLDEGNSIAIRSCYSVVREVQVLHDYLLDVLEHNEDIRPHDIIVLCPAVEDYAPYVDSVFRRPYDQQSDNDPRIVCSIADRAPIDADPMVSMFLDLLSLPDNRLMANQIISYLHLPVIQARLKLSDSDVATAVEWIKASRTYWGFDEEHQSQVLGSKQDGQFSWRWGSERLAKGSLATAANVQQQPTWLSALHGNDWRLHGTVLSFVQSVQALKNVITQPRTPQQWSVFFTQNVLPLLFSEHDQDNKSLQALQKGIQRTVSSMQAANMTATMPLSVIKEELQSVFSTPDTLNQFNTGQVTFSSMVPMRSVPFKVICMLGLNDGVFPRITKRSGIDLMDMTPPMLGDRSRKAEDRYLFLEALLSARQYLYLSYQGRDQYTNKVKEPSLVLFEFKRYLDTCFPGQVNIVEHPLQPFNIKNFEATSTPAFSTPWFSLAQRNNAVTHGFEHDRIVDASTLELARFFKDPSAAFIEKNYGFKWQKYNDLHDDVEPFDLSALTRYGLFEQALQHVVVDGASDFKQNEIINNAIECGELPKAQLEHKIIAAFKALAPIQYAPYPSVTKQALNCVVEWQTWQHSTAQSQIAMETQLTGNLQINEEGELHYVTVKGSALWLRLEYIIQHCAYIVQLGEERASQATFYEMYWNSSSKIIVQNCIEMRLEKEAFSVAQAQAFLQIILQIYHSGIERGWLMNDSWFTKVQSKTPSKYINDKAILEALFNTRLEKLIDNEGEDEAFTYAFSEQYQYPKEQVNMLAALIDMLLPFELFFAKK